MNWISVKERLPEIDNVDIDDGNNIIAYLTPCHGNHVSNVQQVDLQECEVRNKRLVYKGELCLYKSHYRDVTHWMPLPEPPVVDKMETTE